jgi:hypothetical protein
MNETGNVVDFDALVMMPDAEYQRLARIRERQRRQRKEVLYSYSMNKSKSSR